MLFDSNNIDLTYFAIDNMKIGGVLSLEGSAQGDDSVVLFANSLLVGNEKRGFLVSQPICQDGTYKVTIGRTGA